MHTVRGNDRLRDALARSRSPSAERRDVADALFREHLDLAAIRKALGQPMALPRPDPPGSLSPETELNAVDPTESLPELPAGKAGSDDPRRAVASAPWRWASAVGAVIVAASLLAAFPGGGPGPGSDGASDVRSTAFVPPPALAPSRLTTPVTGTRPAAGPADDPADAPVVHRVASLSPPPIPDTTPPMPEAATTIMAQVLAPALAVPARGAGFLVSRSMPERTAAALSGPGALGRPSMESETPTPDLPLRATGNPTATDLPPTGSLAPARRPAEPATPAAVAQPAMAGAPRVVVHYHRAPSAILRDALAAALRHEGFQRIDWRAVPAAVSVTQTRFFHPDDARLATRAVAALTILDEPSRARDFTHFSPPPRAATIEVWLKD